MNKSSGIDMCNGPLFSKIVLFVLPLMASGLLQVLYNAADVIVVGKFSGDDALAAVTSTSPLINLIVNLFFGVSTGVSATVARHLGAGHSKKVHQSVHTSLILAVIGGVLLLFIGVLFAEPMLRLMGVPDEQGASVLEQATKYVRIYFLGMPAFLVYNFGAAVLRAAGDTRRPLIFLSISGLLNVLLNLILVIVFHLGVAGVAIATTMSQILSAILMIRCLLCERSFIRLLPSHLRIHPGIALEILRIGLPSGLQSSLFAISNAIIQSAVNSFGKVVMAGVGASSNLDGFIYTAMNAFYHASLNFTSQNFGARKPKRMLRSNRYCLLLVSVVGLLLGILFFVFGKPLLSIYTDNPEVIVHGINRMRMVGLPYFLCGLMEVMTGHLRGMGFSFVPAIVSLIGACGFRIVWILTVFAAFPSVTVLYLCYPISWILTFCAHAITAHFVRKKVFARLRAIPEPTPQ